MPRDYVLVFHRKLTKPHVRVYRAADRGVRFMWNRYDTATIGCGVVLPTLGRRAGAWCVSLVWAKPVSERLFSSAILPCPEHANRLALGWREAVDACPNCPEGVR